MTTEIKVCGITKTNELECLINNGVDYAGFVLFYPKSKRCVTLNHARRLIRFAGKRIKTIAVMVSPDLDQIAQARRAGFDYVQIHGYTDKDIIARSELPVFLAFNIDTLSDIGDIENSYNIAAIVFDGKNYGAGKVFDWNIIKDIQRGSYKIVLAGGLDPDNVGEGITSVKPDIVDVSSGVEDENGKSKDLIEAFVKAVKQLD